MEKMTDKGLVIGLFVDETPVEAKAPIVTEKVAPAVAEAEVVADETPVMEAEVVEAEEAPRRRGRPRRIID